MKMPTYHVIILAKNDLGRVNLYRLVSWSHVRFFSRRPRIPKSLLNQYREGLIIGSACEAGELYQAILRGGTDAELQRLVRFYDYLEIQPLGNNMFMLRDEKSTVKTVEDLKEINRKIVRLGEQCGKPVCAYLEIQPLGNNMFMLRDEKSTVKTVEDLKEINRKIVRLGEQCGKPVCATCDVHFLDPEDEIYRRILMAGMGFKDSDEQAPLYLRTTEEMLAEFDYLGSDLAYEVVVANTRKIADMCEPIAPVRPDKCPPVIENSDETLRIDYLGSDLAYEVVVANTRKIADMCEPIAPVRPDKCPPVIENSDETLRSICYNRAHEMYGENLPKIVTDRLERELTSIISNGFAVMYIIAQKLVWKSNEDGYLVGSRGSVGSSFVATMSGITEVNPLSPFAVMYIIAQKLVWKSNEDGYLVGSRGSVGSSFVATMSGITEVNPLSPHYYCTNCHYYDFGLPGLRGFVLCGHHVGDHGGKPLKSPLLLYQLPLLRLRLRGSEEIFRYGRL